MEVYLIRNGAKIYKTVGLQEQSWHFKYVGIKEAADHGQPTAFIIELISVMGIDKLKNINDYATLLHP